jgi:hypothetical protein
MGLRSARLQECLVRDAGGGGDGWGLEMVMVSGDHECGGGQWWSEGGGSRTK